MDLHAIAGRVEAHLCQATGATRVAGLEPLTGGACQDNFLVELDIQEGPDRGDHRVVLRSDAAALVEGTLSRKEEFAVINAAVAAGVQTPRARWLGRDLVQDGAWALFLDWAPGVAIGRKVLRDPELADARERLADELALVLARIHSVRPPSAGGAAIPGLVEPPDGDAAAAALRSALAMLDRVSEPHPAMELAQRWLRERAPTTTHLCLAHRDFRTGNFLVTAPGLSAVLDWEFSGWGAPEEDLAWISVRDWRFGRLDRPVGGFARRDPFYAAYEAASGRPVDRRAVHWWEVMGNLRWGLGCVAQVERYTSGQTRDLEMIAIGRRGDGVRGPAPDRAGSPLRCTTPPTPRPCSRRSPRSSPRTCGPPSRVRTPPSPSAC